MLQPPLFNGPNDNPARSFGAIGQIMGHELGHGFDNGGRRHDGDGNEKDWWTDKANTPQSFSFPSPSYRRPPWSIAYEKRTKCFEEEYAGLKVKGQRGIRGTVNGTLTLNENIADNVGIVLAWNAYRKHITTVKTKFNDDEGDRMFFLAFAQTLCSNRRDEYINKNSHPPSQARVNGVVTNNGDFARVFKCKRRSKCSIWYHVRMMVSIVE